MPFEYPKHPNTNHANPLRDPGGSNPFSDDGPDEANSDNPYSASSHTSDVAYRPRDYETTLTSRGRLVFWLGGTGLANSGLGATGVLLLFLAPSANAFNWLYLCAGMLPLGLAFSFAAWLFGSRDLRAIEAGAMEPAGREKTRRGRTMGAIGTLIAVVPVVYAFAQIVKAIADEF